MKIKLSLYIFIQAVCLIFFLQRDHVEQYLQNQAMITFDPYINLISKYVANFLDGFLVAALVILHIKIPAQITKIPFILFLSVTIITTAVAILYVTLGIPEIFTSFSAVINPNAAISMITLFAAETALLLYNLFRNKWRA